MNKIEYMGKEYDSFDSEYEAVLEGIKCIGFLYYPQEKLIIASDNFMSILNGNRVYADIPYSLFNELISKEDEKVFIELAEHINSGEKSYEIILGKNIFFENSRVSITNVEYDSEQRPIKAIGIVQDITGYAKKTNEYNTKLEELLKKQAEDYAITQALSVEYESVYLLDVNHNIVTPIRLSPVIDKLYGPFFRSNPTYEKAFGAYVARTVYVNDQEDMLAECGIDNILKVLENKKMFEREYRVKRDGEIRYYNMRATKHVCENGQVSKIVFGFADVNDQKLRWDKLISNSLTDELTGIGNRRAYDNLINDISNEIPADGIGFISIDANGLKNVNDTLGHAAGDELLMGVAECLSEAFGIENCFRMGGDEFYVVVIAGLELIKEKLTVFNRMMNEWRGQIVGEVSVSYGLAHSDEYVGQSPIILSRIADDVMYKNKVEFYSENGMEVR